MIKKILFLIYISLITTSCGYVPIYSDKNATNFEITNLKIEGNKTVNNIIENKLQKYFNTNSEKKYIVTIKTNYEKASAAKNVTGKTTDFKFTVKLDLNYIKTKLGNNQQEKIITFSESQIIKRDQNNYEQGSYESILIKNMSELLINKVILQLARS